MKFSVNKQTIYELFMILLAALSVATLWNNTGYDSYIVWFTWGIFFIDFIYRLYRSENKWKFIKSNPLLVIAVIPLDALFQMARIARLLHLLRLKTITKYYTMPFIKVLKKRHIRLVLVVTGVIVFILIFPLYLVEPSLTSYWQALLSSLMSLIFFGQSDFDPTTTFGHIIIVILTILGVVLHGIIISTAFDLIYKAKWFVAIKEKVTRKKVS
ncbi:hypothetical protein [Aquibacillus saliphilus]|uniref:hypothetical protein n=1 Tax=Aquibacillus saliphilus TaxID=1909422 RepID=UPI001CEFCAAF|nr:hypothetical protein [Aquibacillus saliphilus]